MQSISTPSQKHADAILERFSFPLGFSVRWVVRLLHVVRGVRVEALLTKFIHLTCFPIFIIAQFTSLVYFAQLIVAAVIIVLLARKTFSSTVALLLP